MTARAGLPDGVRSAVEAALPGRPRIVAVRPVGGGCISPTARVDIEDGGRLFLKWGGPGLPAGMLEAEARGLRALAAAGAVRVPAVLAGGGAGEEAWLALEWLEPGRAGPRTWEDLGRALAALHRARPAGPANAFGADGDNFIGSLPQANAWLERWPEFWWTRRLRPQLGRALGAGRLGPADARLFDRLADGLDALLGPAAAADGPALLHGDLWNGNVHVTDDGVAALIDPSSYHGHREVDLAMADLFGGFPPEFRRAYERAWPLARGYEPGRRSVYQLYYLLVHVNLFGESYVAGTRSALERAVSSL